MPCRCGKTWAAFHFASAMNFLQFPPLLSSFHGKLAYITFRTESTCPYKSCRPLRQRWPPPLEGWHIKSEDNKKYWALIKKIYGPITFGSDVQHCCFSPHWTANNFTFIYRPNRILTWKSCCGFRPYVHSTVWCFRHHSTLMNSHDCWRWVNFLHFPRWQLNIYHFRVHDVNGMNDLVNFGALNPNFGSAKSSFLITEITTKNSTF